MFENIRWIPDNIFGITGNGFVIRENASPENIQTCNGVAVNDVKARTCALCIALNGTVFRNNNKPEYYHPNCKCKNREYELKKVNFDFPLKKITHYLFVNENKRAMMHTMGYTAEDSQELHSLIETEIEHKFFAGEYILKNPDEHDRHFTVNIVLEGKRDHAYE